MRVMDPFPREEALALVRRMPSYGRLAWQLGNDPTLPVSRRGALIGAAAYLLSPIDVVPGIVPLLGQLDDLLVVIVALRFALASMSPDQRQHHLAAVGLSDSLLAADERAILDLGAWTLRAAARTSVRLGRAGVRSAKAGVRAGMLGAERLADVGRSALGAAADAIGRLRDDGPRVGATPGIGGQPRREQPASS
jgi:uncharacterized membrane protein YkvA (DUF1232 family)